MSRRTRKSIDNVCCFCGSSEDNELELGKFYKRGHIMTHYYCLLLSSNMEQRGKDNQGILGFLEQDIHKEVRRGRRLVCSYCKRLGATLGCCNVRCKQIFHYPCGLRAGTLNQFFGEFRSFCVKHRPQQKIDIKVKNELAETGDIVCYICYDSVNPDDMVSTIWAPCCKKNAWFHRKCVQQLAVSAGYFFKCPLCNDKKSFQKAMLQFGIFIPRQDASWELVPNAFEELLFRHDQCDAPLCLCPKGRKYTSINAKWELTLCRTCGSQGIHMACGKLKWANPSWECTECTSILRQSKDANGSSATTLQNDSDSEGSDSDISVGKDSPVPFSSAALGLSALSDLSAIKLLPGPRTYKLKQLKSAQEMQQAQLKNTDVLQNTRSESTTSDSLRTDKPTNSEETAVAVSNLLSVMVPSKCMEYTNSLPEYSKSSTTSINNDATCDSDSDIEEIPNKNSFKSTTVASADKSQTNNVSLPRKTIEVKEKNSSPLIERDNIKENIGNFLTSNLNITETDALDELNLQDAEKSNVLEETIENANFDQAESDYDCVNSLSNIMITNVVSLAPEEFDNVPAIKETEKVSDIECPTPRNNELSNDSLPSFSLFPQSVTSDASSKRKFENMLLTSTPLSVDNTKKMRQSFSPCEQERQTSLSCDAVKNTANDITISNSAPIIILDESDIQVINNKNANSTCNAKQPLHKSYTTLREQKDKNSRTTHEMNERNEAPENAKMAVCAENCDGDAGTSPATPSGKRSFADCTEESVSYPYPKSDSSETLYQWRSGSSAETGTYSASNSGHHSKKTRTDCYHPRLIPNYVRLCDLKFRIGNSNNLEMILYDKFLVNINMENAVAAKNTTVDTTMRNTVQQKSFKTQNETVTSFRPENVHSAQGICNKDKDRYSSYVIEQQPDNYGDDAKENLDPVTISYKSMGDSSSMNTAQCEVENSTQFDVTPMYNMSKIIDDSNRLHGGENVNLINAENNPNAGTVVNAFSRVTMNSKGKHFKSINDVKQNVQSLSPSRVTNRIERHSVRSARIDPPDSTNLFQRDSYCNAENNSTTEIHCKVSIDLNKIEKFISDNPDLFSKVKKDDVEESNLLNRLRNSAAGESRSLANSTLSLSRDRIIGSRSRMNRNEEHITNLMVAENLVQGIRLNNSLPHNQKHDLNCTNGRFETQCIFNR